MKRLAIAFLAVTLTGVGAFADDAANAAALTVPSPLTATLSGDAYAKAGMDLDHSAFGFSNGYDLTLTFALLNGVSVNKGAEGGTISISNHKLFKYDGVTTIKGGDAGGGLGVAANAPSALATFGDIVGKIVLGDLWIQLGDNGAGPNDNVNYQPTVANGDGYLEATDTFQYYNGTYGAGVSFTGTNQGGVTLGAEGKGLSFGYKLPSLVGFYGSVATLNDWTVFTTQSYKVKGEVSLLVDPNLTLVGAYGLSTATAGASGVGVKAGYNLGVINPVVALDYNVTTSKYSAVVNFTAPVIKDELKLLGSVQYDATGAAAKANAWVGIDLAKPVSVKVGAQLIDLTGTLTEAVNVQVSVPVATGISVWAKGSYDNQTISTGSAYAKVGASASGLIPMVTFSGEWDSNNLMGSTNMLGQVYAQALVAY
jgi:hypothetical protein